MRRVSAEFTYGIGRILRGAPALCFLMLIAKAGLPAQKGVLTLDPNQTHIQFILPAFLHTVHGTFNLKNGTIRFEPSGKASGRIVIDAGSGQSGNGSRDRKMHRVVLESSRYPEVIFVPDHMEGQIPAEGAFKMKVHGQLWLHGQPHEVALPVQAVRTGDKITASTQLVIPYVEWGLTNPSTLMLRVSKEVQIKVQSAGKIEATHSVP